MSFEGFYQTVCENGCYYEPDVYDNFEKNNCCGICGSRIIFKNLVDETNGNSDGYICIPVANYKVNDNFFNRYLKYKNLLQEKIEKLIHPDDIIKLPLEKIIELFPYFDKQYTLRIESSLKKDNDNELVPYSYVCFGKTKFIDNNSEIFEEAYMNEYGEISNQGSFECCEWFYDSNIKDMVIKLYKNMWNRTFVPIYKRKNV